MDYNKLSEQLPKLPIKWTVSDIQTWLGFIGLSSLYPKFKQLSIDGSCLHSLTEEDLKEEIGIKSGITIKKIMVWIKKGLTEYEQFLKSEQNMKIEAGIPDITLKHNIIKKESIQENKRQKTQNIPFLHNSIKPSISPSKLKIDSHQKIQAPYSNVEEDSLSDRKKQYELIIQQIEGPQTSFFSVKEVGAKIGRHSSNQILILDQSISRFHAEIKFKDQAFFLIDCGSTTGTFQKITKAAEIFNDMILELGSNQFLAKIQTDILSLEVIEGPAQGTLIEVPSNTSITIGRKQTNSLNFPDDQHLSNLHSTITSSNGKFFIEDMNTTNGTWQRLSLEGEVSLPFQLSDAAVFKIGSNQTYITKIKCNYVNTKINPNNCIICYENDKDCVYMPCKHNVACIKCSKNLKQCPICRLKIEDYVRIYKQ